MQPLRIARPEHRLPPSVAPSAIPRPVPIVVGPHQLQRAERAPVKLVRDREVHVGMIDLDGHRSSMRSAAASKAATTSRAPALDEARGTAGLSKAAFARAIGSDPSTVRRPLSSELVNPTLGTIAEGSAALGMKVMLAPMSAEEHARITEPMRACI